MVEYIERMSAIATACRGCNKQFSNEPCEPSECHIQQGLFNIPAADVVEVVRCKDCKCAYINFFSAASGVAICKHWSNEAKTVIVQQDDFCSVGERIEGE